jgi:hypothetical protein
LLAGLAHEEAAQSLSRVLLTARMF